MDPTRANIGIYEGAGAVADWSADTGLYPVESWVQERFFPPPPACVLDIGCGAGRTTAALVDLGYDVTAVDLSSSMAAATAARVPGATVRVMDATALDLPDASFDAAWFSFNGIDCVVGRANRAAVLAEARRVLRPGSTFAFSSHNVAGQIGVRLARHRRDDLDHVARLLAAQATNPRVLAGWWRLSDQLLYAGRPAATLRLVRRSGLIVRAVRAMARHKDAEALDLAGAVDAGPGAQPAPVATLGSLTRRAGHVQYVTTTPR